MEQLQAILHRPCAEYTGIKPEDCTRHHVGDFMGIVPLWGYQLRHPLSCASVQLNSDCLVAANISIPPMILLLYSSYLDRLHEVLGNLPICISERLSENVKSVLEQYFNRKHYLCNGLQSAVWSNLHRVAGYKVREKRI